MGMKTVRRRGQGTPDPARRSEWPGLGSERLGAVTHPLTIVHRSETRSGDDLLGIPSCRRHGGDAAGARGRA